MARYISQRILGLVPIIFAVSIISFLVVAAMPGDAVDTLMGSEGGNPAVARALRQKYGLQGSYPERYVRWAGNLLHGDFGISPSFNKPVGAVLLERMEPTIELGVLSLVLGVVIAVPCGIVSAMQRGTPLDALVTIGAVGGVAIPSFFLGILLVLLFSVTWKIFPPSGYVRLFSHPGDALLHLVLPVVTLGTSLSAALMRQIRGSMLNVLSQDYVRTARSKGLRERVVILRHGLRNALIPVLTVLGLQTAAVLGGAVILENVFAIPGIGRLTTDSFLSRDYFVLQAVLFWAAIIVLCVNLLTDVVYAYVDPRVRYG